MRVEVAAPADREAWNAYVKAQHHASLYHLYDWNEVFRQAFGCETFYLVAKSNGQVRGVLPLFSVKNYILGGNYISSLPGGLCTGDQDVAHQLIETAGELTREKGAKYLRLRDGVQCWRDESLTTRVGYTYVLDQLPSDSEVIWKTLRSTVRTRIRKARKEKLVVVWGKERLDDFYRVYTINMRDLGTPAIPWPFFELCAQKFTDYTKLLTVQIAGQVIGGLFFFSFNGVLYNPFASSLRRFFHLCPNDLLYWETINFACKHDYQAFDMGTSIKNSGHARFKEKFLARPQELFHHYYLNSARDVPASRGGKVYPVVSRIWKRLPLSIANWVSPLIRRMIPLG